MKLRSFLVLGALAASLCSPLSAYAQSESNAPKASQLDQARAAYERGEFDAAARLTLPLAEQGNALAQYNLGVMYQNGQGVGQDSAVAVSWFRKAAEQGYGLAQYNLGVMYRDGQGVARSYASAASWFRKAADQENAFAQYNLGVMYQNGQGVGQDATVAVGLYRKAAEQGYVLAQYNLGVMYRDGQGVARSYGAAVSWFRKAMSRRSTISGRCTRTAKAWRGATTPLSAGTARLPSKATPCRRTPSV